MSSKADKRTVATKPEDLRSVKSREALKKALLALLEEKSLGQISAKDITDRARVGYATYFRHYDNVGALLNDLAAEQVSHVMSLAMPSIDDADTQAACTALCRYVDDHRDLWRALLTGGGAGAVREEFLRVSQDLINEGTTPPATWLPMGLGIILTVTCTVELLSWWLSQPRPHSVEWVAQIMDGALHQRLLNDHIVKTP